MKARMTVSIRRRLDGVLVLFATMPHMPEDLIRATRLQRLEEIQACVKAQIAIERYWQKKKEGA